MESVKKELAEEFRSFAVDSAQVDAMSEVRGHFDQLLVVISNRISPNNGRYVSLVKTKLEEACFFAIKGISKK